MRGLRLATVLPPVTSAQTPAGPPPLRNLTRTMDTPRTELFAVRQGERIVVKGADAMPRRN